MQAQGRTFLVKNFPKMMVIDMQDAIDSRQKRKDLERSEQLQHDINKLGEYLKQKAEPFDYENFWKVD